MEVQIRESSAGRPWEETVRGRRETEGVQEWSCGALSGYCRLEMASVPHQRFLNAATCQALCLMLGVQVWTVRSHAVPEPAVQWGDMCTSNTMLGPVAVWLRRTRWGKGDGVPSFPQGTEKAVARRRFFNSTLEEVREP